MKDIKISEQDLLERANAIRKFVYTDTDIIGDVTSGFGGRRIPIWLTFGESIARTDCNTIMISLPVGILGMDIETAPKHVRNTLRSMIYHEAAHCLWTDYRGGEYSNYKNPKEAIEAVHPFLPIVLNAFEDIRIDHDMAVELPAYSGVRAISARHSLQASSTGNAENVSPEMQVVFAAVFADCNIPEHVLYKKFPAAVQYRELVDDILHANIQSTEGAYGASLAWYEKAKAAGLLTDPTNNDEPQGDGGDGEMDSQPDTENDSPAGDDDCGSGSASGNVPDAEQRGNSNKPSTADAPEKTAGENASGQQEYSGAQDLQDILKDSLADNIPTDIQERIAERMNSAENLSDAINDPSTYEARDLSRMSEIKYVKGTVRFRNNADKERRMRKVHNIDTRDILEIRRIFHANARQGYAAGFATGKRIKSRNMVHAMTGTSNAPFVRRDSITKKSYAVALVVDASSSMAGDAITTAMASALLITDLLNSVGVKVRITKYSSYTKTDIEVVKEFDTPLTKDLRYNILGSAVVGCSTPTYFGVHEAAKNLLKRPENTKLLIDLSDGAPGPNGDFQKAALKALIAETPEICFAQLGIKTPPFEEAYDKTRRVDSLEQLPPEVISLLKEMLER